MQDTGDPDSAAAGRGLGIPAAARALWRPEIYGSSSCVLDYPAEGRQRPVRGVAIDVLATQDVRGELELEAAEEALLASELMEFVEPWVTSTSAKLPVVPAPPREDWTTKDVQDRERERGRVQEGVKPLRGKGVGSARSPGGFSSVVRVPLCPTELSLSPFLPTPLPARHLPSLRPERRGVGGMAGARAGPEGGVRDGGPPPPRPATGCRTMTVCCDRLQDG
ncbi:hypothetical protein STEG23_033266 [Scotinomys teguina]